MWAYPLETGIVSPETIEAVLTGEASEELAFRQDYDRHAKVVDLKPGQMITWPQHTPHRVVNTSGLNVSLSTEHMTQRALRKNNVYLANRHFRRMFGRGFTSTTIEGPAAALKEAAIRIVRRLPIVGPQPPQGFKYPDHLSGESACAEWCASARCLASGEYADGIRSDRRFAGERSAGFELIARSRSVGLPAIVRDGARRSTPRPSHSRAVWHDSHTAVFGRFCHCSGDGSPAW